MRRDDIIVGVAVRRRYHWTRYHWKEKGVAGVGYTMMS